MKARLYNCDDDAQTEWLRKVWALLYRHTPNKYRELDMIPMLPYYKAGITPATMAATLIQNKAFDARTTNEYIRDVVYGRQGPTTHKGVLRKYLSFRVQKKLKNY